MTKVMITEQIACVEGELWWLLRPHVNYRRSQWERIKRALEAVLATLRGIEECEKVPFKHASDCAIYNGPSENAGECDCGPGNTRSPGGTPPEESDVSADRDKLTSPLRDPENPGRY